MTRLKSEDRSSYESQSKSLEEVWFPGCHSDVGCGPIALRWMLAEAVEDGLAVTDATASVLASDDPAPTVEESDRWYWRVVEQIPRKEIDNSGVWPIKKWRRGRTGVRKPDGLRRAGAISLHNSVPADREFPQPVRRVQTKAVGMGPS